MFQKFDEAEDKKFYDLCQLDEKPIICTDPVEESKYLGVKLYTSEEGYQQILEKAYHHYTASLDQFIRQNIKNDKTYLLATLNRLLGKYNNLLEQFRNSSVKIYWHNLSKNYIISNPEDDYNIKIKQKHTREAYRFFNKMAATQMYFIEKIIEFLKLQISPYDQETIENRDENLYFKINADVKRPAELIEYLYDKLMEEPEPFIKCKKREFKKLFKPSDEIMQPIIWNKDYIHLSYFIKQLTNSIVIKQTAPSQYEIAAKLFYNKIYGIYFTPSRYRHNTDPAKPEKDKINSIVRYAEKTYLP